MTHPIEVAVAVIRDAAGRVLLSKRPEHVHQGGLWEFPGGKLESGESLSDALVREISEELGIQIESHEPLIRLVHAYPDKTVALDVHRVLDFRGIPAGVEGQLIDWVAIDELQNHSMPAADKPIINALRLPDKYLITGADSRHPEQFLTKLDQVLATSPTLLQFRAPNLKQNTFQWLAEEVIQSCKANGCQVVLNSDPGLAVQLNADGVHLNSKRLLMFTSRPVPKNMWLAVSCHDKPQLEHAMKLDADFVVLSPVLATVSHPLADPIGWEAFASLTKHANLPVYALGGVGEREILQSKQSGGQGVAGISAFWP